MIMKKLTIISILVFIRLFCFADEGMWIPMFLGYNEAEMQQMGFHLTAEDVYSVNHHSMKDAIVLFGGGCTGELISADGLLITNHHCGYSHVQRHSSLEHNYLHNGFWAKSRDEELPTEGLTVTFLVKMEDVTAAMLEGITPQMSEDMRAKKLEENKSRIVSNFTCPNAACEVVIKPFFYGNQYFMFINEVYKDVRLVGVPPESIGKFGGDTDNWMWPRHTGDFSLWRIYTAPDGSPAEYSPNNVPMKSKKFFTISSKGVKENDFTLVFGYPGKTEQFLISDGVDLIVNVQNPIAIHSRDIRLAAMKRQMEKSTAIRLMYSAKANSISNGWKKWIGQNKGILECHVIDKKIEQEKEFMEWVHAQSDRINVYGNLLDDMKKCYHPYREQVKKITFIGETFLGTEMLQFLLKIYPVAYTAQLTVSSDEEFEKQRSKLVEQAISFFKSYNYDIDAECFVELMYYYFTSQDVQWIPNDLKRYVNLPKQEWQNILSRNQQKGITFYNSEQMIADLRNMKRKDFAKLIDHELIRMMQVIYAQYVESYDALRESRQQLEGYYRLYVKALMEKDTDKTFYPDANLTMRVTYGNVKGFSPADGIDYVYYTTLEGIMEKDNPEIFDYKVDSRLKDLYQQKDYGVYANADGELPVCFIASNHTTGGNSGSPVINADGELIGVNFDRVWEGTMSDINYDVSRCRNISLDIRYFLFIVDKFANAQNILNELVIK